MRRGGRVAKNKSNHEGVENSRLQRKSERQRRTSQGRMLFRKDISKMGIIKSQMLHKFHWRGHWNHKDI